MLQSKSVPLFKGKAANTMKVLLWLEHILAQRPAATAHAKVVACVVRAVCRQWRLVHVPSVWFSHLQARAFYRDGVRILTCLKTLFMESNMLGKKHWSLKPTHHQFLHLCKSVLGSRRNPASHWCFSDERFVGHVTKVVPTLRPTRRQASRRVLQRHYIHLRLLLAGRVDRKRKFAAGSTVACMS